MKPNKRKTFTVDALIHIDLTQIKLDIQEKEIRKGNTTRVTFDDVLRKLIEVYNDVVKGLS